jgi:hypothetical protein
VSPLFLLSRAFLALGSFRTAIDRAARRYRLPSGSFRAAIDRAARRYRLPSGSFRAAIDRAARRYRFPLGSFRAAINRAARAGGSPRSNHGVSTGPPVSRARRHGSSLAGLKSGVVSSVSATVQSHHRRDRVRSPGRLPRQGSGVGAPGTAQPGRVSDWSWLVGVKMVASCRPGLRCVTGRRRAAGASRAAPARDQGRSTSSAPGSTGTTRPDTLRRALLTGSNPISHATSHGRRCLACSLPILARIRFSL